MEVIKEGLWWMPTDGLLKGMCVESYQEVRSLEDVSSCEGRTE